MKTIPEQFEKKGSHYRQILREGDVAIYERKKGNFAHFEVVVIGTNIPPSEMYPTSEQWGTKGWTFQDEESARKFFSGKVLLARFRSGVIR